MYDIIIIGAGPAGTTLARLVSDNRVLLIGESGSKPCGGLLSPDAQKYLAKSGMVLPKDILVDPQIFAVDTIDLRQNIRRKYLRTYLNVNRRKFDEFLLSKVPDNIKKVVGQATDIKKNSNYYTVKYIENGEEKIAESKYIVGADGGNSFVRRTLFPNVKITHYTAIQQHFISSDIKPFYGCFFDREATDCCGWAVCKDGELIFGGAFKPEKSREKFELMKSDLKKFGVKLENEISTEACVVLRPKSVKEIFCGKDNAFLIGEAAGFISPSSLEGISRAFESAEALAQSFNSNNPNKEYFKNTRKMRFTMFLKLMKCPFLYNPLLRKIVMKSRISSIS